MVVGKANRSLSLLRRNFSTCTRQIREKLYFALVRPHLKYAYEVWSPHTADSKHRIEMVQRNGARFVMGDYGQRSSVTDLLSHLKWDSLESRRLLFQLKCVHKMFTNQVALKPLDYFSMAALERQELQTQKRLCQNLEELMLLNFHSFFQSYPF